MGEARCLVTLAGDSDLFKGDPQPGDAVLLSLRRRSFCKLEYLRLVSINVWQQLCQSTAQLEFKRGLTLGVLGVDWEPPWSPTLLWSAGFSELQKGDLWGLQGAAWWQTQCLSNQMWTNKKWQRDINTVTKEGNWTDCVCCIQLKLTDSLLQPESVWWHCKQISLRMCSFKSKLQVQMFFESYQLLVWLENVQTYSSNLKCTSKNPNIHC